MQAATATRARGSDRGDAKSLVRGYGLPVSPRILVIVGSQRPEPRLRALAGVAAQSATNAGGDVELLDLASLSLPVMLVGDAGQDELPAIQRVRKTAREADGFIITTPEYHGSMSGALKNWFDFLYEELAGKVAGVLATTGGGSGDMSIAAVKTSFQWCHGFVLPFHAAATDPSLVEEASMTPRVRARVERIGHDVVRYARVIRPAFEEARARAAEGSLSGFAGEHGT